MKFVVDTIRGSERNPLLGDYAVAQVFGETRAAGTLRSRAEAMAADLADGQTPAQVRAFRESILDPAPGPRARRQALRAQGRASTPALLPGYGGVKGKDVADAVYFTIGPDKQLDAWEAYLKNAEGAETKLVRLYPRDFWMP